MLDINFYILSLLPFPNKYDILCVRYKLIRDTVAFGIPNIRMRIITQKNGDTLCGVPLGTPLFLGGKK